MVADYPPTHMVRQGQAVRLEGQGHLRMTQHPAMKYTEGFRRFPKYAEVTIKNPPRHNDILFNYANV